MYSQGDAVVTMHHFQGCKALQRSVLTTEVRGTWLWNHGQACSSGFRREAIPLPITIIRHQTNARIIPASTTRTTNNTKNVNNTADDNSFWQRPFSLWTLLFKLGARRWSEGLWGTAQACIPIHPGGGGTRAALTESVYVSMAPASGK